jgi:hypothetical protein
MTDYETANRNEDWLKTRTWDLYRHSHLIDDLPGLLWALGADDDDEAAQRKAVADFTRLPAWGPAPAKLKFAVEAFLAQPKSVSVVLAEARFKAGWSTAWETETRGAMGRWEASAAGGGTTATAGPSSSAPTTATTASGYPGEHLRPLVPVLNPDGSPSTTPNMYAVNVNGINGVNQVHAYLNKMPANQRPSDEQIQRALSTLADLYERYPLKPGPYPEKPGPDVKDPYWSEAVYGPPGHPRPSINIMSGAQMAKEPPGAVAFVDPSDLPLIINLSGPEMRTDVTSTDDPDWSMPARQHMNGIAYTVTHEYGHVMMATGTWAGPRHKSSTMDRSALQAMGKQIMAAGQDPKDGALWKGLSEYGQSNIFEAQAESFAEYAGTNGTTRNVDALAFAKAGGMVKK